MVSSLFLSCMHSDPATSDCSIVVEVVTSCLMIWIWFRLGLGLEWGSDFL